jgi:hypothetical protein
MNQKMPQTPRPSMLRKVLDEQFSILAGELTVLYEQELKAAEEEQRESLRCELAESLNQGVRMLSQATDFQQLASVLVDSSAVFCHLLAVFSIHGALVHGERVRGLAREVVEHFSSLEFRLEQAAAFAGAIQAGDPVVAMTTPREISHTLAQTFAHKPDDRAYILPLFVQGKASGVLYASGSVEMAPLELLAQTAALALSVLEGAAVPEPAPKSDLVTIQSTLAQPAPARAPAAEQKVPESWTELPPRDQELHLRAQRFARVHVAGIRLYSADGVRQGRKIKDLYTALRKDIDAGRTAFEKTFRSATPTMLDYFHVELVRTLANDDASLLGKDYPGPLA